MFPGAAPPSFFAGGVCATVGGFDEPKAHQVRVRDRWAAVSSIGKGLASASVGALLEARGLRVTNVKLDPYINVDPGTMSPYQHGEVYVTDDGAETDLDPGTTSASPPRG